MPASRVFAPPDPARQWSVLRADGVPRDRAEPMRKVSIQYSSLNINVLTGDGMTTSMVKTEVKGRVALVTLDRPKALNALNNELIDELAEALRGFDADDNIGAIVLTGSEKAFAAGADIGAMQSWSYIDVYKQDYLGGNWES